MYGKYEWFGMLVCHQYDGYTNYICSVYIDGYCSLSEHAICVLRELCPVCFLVVGEGPSALL